MRAEGSALGSGFAHLHGTCVLAGPLFREQVQGQEGTLRGRGSSVTTGFPWMPHSLQGGMGESGPTESEGLKGVVYVSARDVGRAARFPR